MKYVQSTIKSTHDLDSVAFGISAEQPIEKGCSINENQECVHSEFSIFRVIEHSAHTAFLLCQIIML